MARGAEPSRSRGWSDADGPRVLEYWQILRERWRVAAAGLAVTVLATLLATFLSTPLYRASTTLQIERQAPDILTFKDVLGMDPMGYYDFYQTQYKVLQSRAVLEVASDRLDLVHRPEFVSRTGSPARRMIGKVMSLFAGASESGEADPTARAVAFLRGGLAVEPERNSQLVRVSFTDRDPVVARDVANAIADAYLQFNLEARYGTTEQASEFLAKEVARTEARIVELEQALQRYGVQKEIVHFSVDGQNVGERVLADLNASLARAKSRLAAAQAHWEEIQDTDPDSLSEVLESGLIQNLKQQYAELERRHGQMSERFKPGWPALSQLRHELEQAEERLEIEIETIARQVRQVARLDYEQALAEVRNLQAQVDAQKDVVQRQTMDGLRYSSLKEEIETRRNVLRELIARQSQTETSGKLRDTGASNVRVVDRAELPRVPAAPRKAFNLAISLFVGSFLGVGMALLLHFLDNTIKTEHDIQRYGKGVAILGHVPLFRPLRVVADERSEVAEDAPTAALGSHVDSRSVFAESFKNLRTSLLLASPDRPPRQIVVTSCQPGDGKSTIAANLATVLTQMDRRVLLVDADLRRPRVHAGLSVANDVGLSSYLTGNSTLDEVVRPTAVPKLDVITSGPLPPNPSELLDSPRLDDVLGEVGRRGYDHVIIDSPPALHVADSLILAAKAESTLVVVRAGATTRDALAHGIDRLVQGRARIVGAVLNAVVAGSGYHRYYYYRDPYYQNPSEPARPSPVARGRRRSLLGKRLGSG